MADASVMPPSSAGTPRAERADRGEGR
ncbi:MAG TPA: hypothetical protein VLZ05_13775 [Mycobacterium sp.]|nr:hypothetical protein [Mycobacterium sp.]HUH69827.1 hypothetical protein [Mycobacterium sp.]